MESPISRSHRCRSALLCAAAAAIVLLGAQTAPITIIPSPLRTVQVGADGGNPSFVMMGAGGQELKATDDLTNPGLYVRLDDYTIATLIKGITDACPQGLQVFGVSVADESVGSTSTYVPVEADGGLPAADLSVVEIFVQNVSTNPAIVARCIHNPFDAGVQAACNRGIELTNASGAGFPVRYPDALACICCNAGGAPTVGCSISSTVRLCVQPPIP